MQFIPKFLFFTFIVVPFLLGVILLGYMKEEFEKTLKNIHKK